MPTQTRHDMSRQLVRFRITSFVLGLFFPWLLLFAQSAPPAATAKTPMTPEQAMEAAEQGRCKEAIPALKRAVSTSSNAAELRKNAGVLGLRCSLATDDRNAATSFIELLHKEFPQDPDVLFILVHAYSDLSTRTAQDLGRMAPQSIAAHKLMAEAFEMQGNWDQARHEYEEMIKKEPNTSGLHFLYGRSLLSQPNASSETIELATQEFRKELEIDPKNAGAHYILGELARKRGDCDEAIVQFAQSTKLDPNLAEAYLGSGYCLITLRKYDDAIAQLRSAERMLPFDGSVHFALATALNSAGQKDEAQKEFEIHRKLTAARAPPNAGANPQ
jgi:tetratricopeptide (TPR) repeat protein